MSKSTIRANYLRVLSQWPVDALRPNVSFQKSIRNRIDKRLSDSPSPSADNVVANEAQATVPTPKPFAQLQETAQVNVLYSFLEDRYSRKYPLSERIMKPASNPTYYDDLLKELNEAPNRSWFQRLVKRWSGFIRLS